MKKLLLSIMTSVVCVGGIFAQTTYLYDDFTLTNGYGNYNIYDQDLPSATNKWSLKASGWNTFFGLGNFLPNEGTGSINFEGRYNCTTGAALTNDNLPENGVVRIKAPFSTAGSTKLFIALNHVFYSYSTATTDHGFVELSKDSVNWASVIDLTTTTISFIAKLPDSFANQPVVYARFRYVGNFSGNWTIDDVKFYQPSPGDVRMNGLNPSILKKWFKANSPNDVVFSVTNFGGDTIKSLKMTYNIGGTGTQTAVATGLSIPPLATGNVTHPNKWTPTTDGFSYTINGITDSVNGIPDASTTNNTASKSAIVYTNGTKRKPLYEVFTSSTCPPCNPGNANFHSIVDTADVNNYVQIKYQQDFPGTGDPYATNETVNRRGTFYAINSIPRMEINGEWDGNANSFTPDIHNEANTIPATFDITPSCVMDAADSMFSATIKFKSLNSVTANQFKVYAAICEGVTKNNVKTNGETEFYMVTKKMMPDQNGTVLPSSTINNTDSVKLSYNLDGPYKLAADGTTANRIDLTKFHSIENFNNLYLVTWIQHTASKAVVQANTTKITIKPKSGGTSAIINNELINKLVINPNPAVDVVHVNLNAAKDANLNIVVFNTLGEVVRNIEAKVNNGANKIEMNVNDLSNGNYIVKVLSGNEEIARDKFIVAK